MDSASFIRTSKLEDVLLDRSHLIASDDSTSQRGISGGSGAGSSGYGDGTGGGGGRKRDFRDGQMSRASYFTSYLKAAAKGSLSTFDGGGDSSSGGGGVGKSGSWGSLRGAGRSEEGLGDGESSPSSVRKGFSIKYNNNDCFVKGSLHLTAHHILFSPKEREQFVNEYWVLYMNIYSVEKKALTSKGTPIVLKTKDYLVVTFIIPRERDAMDLFETMSHLAYPDSLEKLYAFHFKPDYDSVKVDGWKLYNVHEEYLRMLSDVPNDVWVLSDINKDFEVCPTYPQWLWVPAIVNEFTLKGSAKFRSKGRLPVLSYLYPTNLSAIVRCSQPLGGMKQKRAPEDEKLIQSVWRVNPNRTSNFILDARPKVNAMANRAGGAGYENTDYYVGCGYHFLGIDNIHVMRESLMKMVSNCQSPHLSAGDFQANIDSSGWLKHIKGVMDSAILITEYLHSGSSCVVHCSDGWDRTSQLTSLPQLLLDPFYRTIKGFIVLIEKEWLSFGHKFSERCGHFGGLKSSRSSKLKYDNSNEFSPVFTQFLECAYHFMTQNPTAFEFNEQMLITINESIFSCKYGTFLGNCVRERKEWDIASKTSSLWDYIFEFKSMFTNSLYNPNEAVFRDYSNINDGKGPELYFKHLEPLAVDSHPQYLKFWKRLYCHWVYRELAPHVHIQSPDAKENHEIEGSWECETISELVDKKLNHREEYLNACLRFYQFAKWTESMNSEEDGICDWEDVGRPSTSDIQFFESIFEKGGDYLTQVREPVFVDVVSSEVTHCQVCSSHLSMPIKIQKTFCRNCSAIICCTCARKRSLPVCMYTEEVDVCVGCFKALLANK
eukprot:Nk52_evm16s554 gene=Nk52_evmTU16s554